jgi:hypothetical protein
MGSPISWPVSSVRTNFSPLMRCPLLNQLRSTYLHWFHPHSRFLNHWLRTESRQSPIRIKQSAMFCRRPGEIHSPRKNVGTTRRPIKLLHRNSGYRLTRLQTRRGSTRGRCGHNEGGRKQSSIQTRGCGKACARPHCWLDRPLPNF